MIPKRIIKYLLLLVILLGLGLWCIQSFYYSAINIKISARKKIKETVDMEYDKSTKSKLQRYINNRTSRPTTESSIVVTSSTIAVKTTTTMKKSSIQTVVSTFGLHSIDEAENLYFKTITQDTIQCKESKRFGRADDGGWDVCVMGNLNIKKDNCMVYSFGVNYIWEFDDELALKYNCVVRAFDPSMENEPDQYQRSSKVWFYKLGIGKEDTVWPNGWKIFTFYSLLKRFNEQNKVIDIFKIDVEFSEWDSFASMLHDGLFANVKQLLFETHTEELQSRTTSLASYIRFLTIWNDLYKLGFRQWKHHWNHFGNFQSMSGVARTCCHEHYLVNINFL